MLLTVHNELNTLVESNLTMSNDCSVSIQPIPANGDGTFVAGRNMKPNDTSAIGSVALAIRMHCVGKDYGIQVVLHLTTTLRSPPSLR